MKPQDLFDRDREWDSLVRFASDSSPEPALGIVYGRRRQGKTFLLEALTRSLGGVLHIALQDVAPRALADLGRALGTVAHLPGALTFTDWTHAVDAILELGKGPRPFLIVLDEFPFLAAASPELPSVIQRALAPGSPAAAGSRTRLILCGSAMSVMGKLLSGSAPLRGRAAMDLIINPFDFRQAADFWGMRESFEAAFMVHAVLGGTPAYRALLRGAKPGSAAGFSKWVQQSILDPASPLAREGNYLLAEEPSLTDRALYNSVLRAIAEGHARRSQIAAALGRKDSDLAHPLNVLLDLGLVRQTLDPLKPRRRSFSINEPIVRFHHAVMRPLTDYLAAAGPAQAWATALPGFESLILGPHFEELAREWTRRFASVETLGARVEEVGHTVVNDKAQRRSFEVDVVGVARSSCGRRVLAVLGEAKWSGRPLGDGDLARLEHVRQLLAKSTDLAPEKAKLVLFSRKGFSKRLRELDRSDVVLVDLPRLYEGA